MLAIKDEFKISDTLWEECITTIGATIKRRQSIDYKISNPDKNHSLQSLDSESFQRIKEALEACKINFNAIDIVYDEQREELASSYVHGEQHTPRFHFTPKHSKKMQNSSHAYQRYHQLHCPAHEVTHIAEVHCAQESIMKNDLVKFGYEIPYIVQQQSWKNWIRIHEKIADLMPLLLPQPIGSLEALFLLGIHECSNKQTPIIWNQSDPDAIHPDFAELFPYLVKIQELSGKEV